ncbi:MAG: amino acid ABC transporter substrate-binding protein [Chloroflexi bacterium]|nr:amino acid ABC transporter substrate-binding protein [Chloroflexota bacterium]
MMSSGSFANHRSFLKRFIPPRLILLGLLLLASVVVAACTPAATPAPATEAPQATATSAPMAATDLPVGVILPFSGQYAWVGGNVLPVARMIAEEVNKSGGIGGGKIVLVQGDTEGVVDAGTTAAQKLVKVDGVLAFLGPTSLSFNGVKTVVQDNKVPMLSPTAGTTKLDKAGKGYFFRTVPSDSLGGRAIARAITDPKTFMGRDGNFSSVVLMVGQAPAMISFKDPIAESMTAFGSSLAATIEYKTEKQAYRTEVQEALKANPDIIILVGTPEDSARIMQAAFEAGYKGAWFVTQDQTTDDYIKLASPELVEGIYGLEEVPAAETADRTAAFKTQFKDFSGEDVKIFGTNTYDAANILFLAMLRAQLKDGQVTRATIAANIPQVANPGPDKVEVTNFAEGKKALEAGKEINYQGLVGPVDFNEYGNIAAPFGIRQVKGGAWTTAATIQASDLQ